MNGERRAAPDLWSSLPGAVTFRASRARRVVGWGAALTGAPMAATGVWLVATGRFSPGVLLLAAGVLLVAEGWSTIVTRIEVSPYGVRSWRPPARHTVERGAITGLTVSGEFLGEDKGRILIGLRAGGPVAMPALFLHSRGRASQEKTAAVAAEMARILGH